MQTRAKTGIDFEILCESDGWIRQTKSPKIKWNGKGRCNITKIKNCNFNPSIFTMSEKSNLSKYDLYNPTLGKYREVKKYEKSKLKSWVMYSEPYFKIASWTDVDKIDKTTYNKFVQDFWDYNLTTGLFDEVEKGINEQSDGVQCIDGFIPKDELEFRTVIVKSAWGGYHRITIQFRLKCEI